MNFTQISRNFFLFICLSFSALVETHLFSEHHKVNLVILHATNRLILYLVPITLLIINAGNIWYRFHVIFSLIYVISRKKIPWNLVRRYSLGFHGKVVWFTNFYTNSSLIFECSIKLCLCLPCKSPQRRSSNLGRYHAIRTTVSKILKKKYNFQKNSWNYLHYFSVF